MKEYHASFDLTTKIVTAVIAVLNIPFIYYTYHNFSKSPDEIWIRIGLGLMLGLVISMIPITYLFHTKFYTLTTEALLIHRPLSIKTILLRDIDQVRIPDQSEFSGTIRTFGVGGIFGYYGKFYNTALGHMNWFVTQRQNRILITLKSGKKIVISPDDTSLAEAIIKCTLS